jgi:hypothetical protein
VLPDAVLEGVGWCTDSIADCGMIRWLIIGLVLPQACPTTDGSSTQPFHSPLCDVLEVSHAAQTRTQKSLSRSNVISQQQRPLRPRISGKPRKAAAVELIEPVTGCNVVLVGCFHGSPSSAADVQNAFYLQEPPDSLSSAPPFESATAKGKFSRLKSGSDLPTSLRPCRRSVQLAVLELCTDRFVSLSRVYDQKHGMHMLRQPQFELDQGVVTDSFAADSSLPAANRDQAPWYSRLAASIQRVAETRGVAAATATALVGGVTGIQAAISGLYPGLEFLTAFRMVDLIRAEEQRLSANEGVRAPSVDFILADRAVDDTLERIGEIPPLSVELWRSFLSRRKSWNETFGQEAAALRTALFGGALRSGNNKLSPPQLSLPSFVSRSPPARWDFFRLVVPPFILIQGLLWTISYGVGMHMPLVLAASDEGVSIQTTSPAPASLSLLPTSADDVLGHLVGIVPDLMVLILTYMSIALPAVQVVIRERDERLTAGILAACEIAVKRMKQQQHHHDAGIGGDGQQRPDSKATVVAVLGFLHVNGVSNRLMQKPKTTDALQAGKGGPT